MNENLIRFNEMSSAAYTAVAKFLLENPKGSYDQFQLMYPGYCTKQTSFNNYKHYAFKGIFDKYLPGVLRPLPATEGGEEHMPNVPQEVIDAIDDYKKVHNLSINPVPPTKVMPIKVKFPPKQTTPEPELVQDKDLENKVEQDIASVTSEFIPTEEKKNISDKILVALKDKIAKHPFNFYTKNNCKVAEDNFMSIEAKITDNCISTISLTTVNPDAGVNTLKCSKNEKSKILKLAQAFNLEFNNNSFVKSSI